MATPDKSIIDDAPCVARARARGVYRRLAYFRERALNNSVVTQNVAVTQLGSS